MLARPATYDDITRQLSADMDELEDEDTGPIAIDPRMDAFISRAVERAQYMTRVEIADAVARCGIVASPEAMAVMILQNRLPHDLRARRCK